MPEGYQPETRDYECMNSAVTIRKATAEDLDQLVQLRLEMDAEEGAAPAPGFPDQFREWYSAYSERFTVVVADLHGQLLGTVWLERVERIPRPAGVPAAPFGYVTFTFVTREHRNAGIGQQMLELLRSEALKMGCETLIVWPSERSTTLYERGGFSRPGDLLEQPLA